MSAPREGVELDAVTLDVVRQGVEEIDDEREHQSEDEAGDGRLIIHTIAAMAAATRRTGSTRPR